MAAVVFDREALTSWKLRLERLASHEVIQKEDILACLESLEELESRSPPPKAPPVHITDAEKEGLQRVLAVTPTRVEASTQLWTVRPIHYTHHVLNHIRREGQVKRMAQWVGQLASSLYTLAEDFWKFLFASRMMHLLLPASEAGTTGKCSLSSPTPCAATDTTVVLSASTVRILNIFFHKTSSATPAFRFPYPSHPPALQFDLPLSSNRKDAGVQASLNGSSPAYASDNEQRRQPTFLCRRCRQDGRAGYDVDKSKMRLLKARDVEAVNTPTHRPTPPQYNDTKRTGACLAHMLPTGALPNPLGPARGSPPST